MDRLLVRRWLVALNVALLAFGLVVGASVSRRGFFLAALVPLAVAPFSYARWRLHAAVARALGPGRRGAWLLGAIAVAGIVLDVVLVAQLLSGGRAGGLRTLQRGGVSWIGPVWFSAHALLLLGYVASDALRATHRLVRGGVRFLAPRPAPPPRAPLAAGGGPERPERREFLRRVSVVGAGVPFAAAVSGVPLSYDFRVEERQIPVPGWPRALDGLRVVHLSDIHVGGAMTRARLLRVAALTNDSRPDLVLHTGDFLTHRSGEFDAPLYEALARIRAPHGQWACLGNHDYDHPDRLVRHLGEAGVTVLRDRLARVLVDATPLEVGGLDFVFGRTSRQARYARVMRAWSPRDDAPRLLLNHDPTAFGALRPGCADLVLSGHTHGGHIGVQLGPDAAVTVVGLLGLPDQGLFARGDMRLFVTRCVGFYGYPMRVGIPPEIAVLVLRTPGPDVVARAPRPA